MTDRVLIGASIGRGLAGLETFARLRLGNCALADLPFDRDEAVAMMRFCREHKITLFLSELAYRGSTELYRPEKRDLPREEFWTREELDAIVAEAGEFYGGRMTIGEAGGVLYWPKDYLLREGARTYNALPPCDTMLEAREAYLDYLRGFIDFEREELGGGPLMNVESSLVFKYHAEAGIDVLCHESLPGDPHRMQAAVRGAARAFGRPWGTHIAMGWYGGVTVDELWLKRWKSSVWHCYLTGSEFIYPESGHLALTEHQTGRRLEARSPEMVAARGILREACQFSLVHRRPTGGPKVTLGILSGYGDGAPGLWNPWAWGQSHDDRWLAGPPERAWELPDQLHRREEWSNYTVQGERDWSGNPPWGQYDIVPIESELANLQRYECLVLLGWNTMTEELYEKLKAYVGGGGRLVLSLPHLRADSVRGGAPQLFRDGDLSDLCGVKVTGALETAVRGVKFLEQSSLRGYRLPVADVQCDPRFLGNFTPATLELTSARVLAGHDILFAADADEIARRPVLVENRVGEGSVLLVTLWEYPADEAVVGLTRELLRVVSAGEQGEVRLLGSDRVRYAVYELESGAGEVIYLLNTDPDCAAPVRLWVDGRESAELLVPACEFTVAYRLGPVIVLPMDRRVNLERAEWDGDALEMDFHAVLAQEVAVENLAEAAVTVTLNGCVAELAAGTRAGLPLERAVPEDATAYSPEFADEPDYQGEIDAWTPY
ncbi:MAG: hypothetical protein ACOX9R_19170 [Armatimonadota bacterium]|jgi:hypothetical protein